MYVEVPVACHPVALKEAKSVPLPLSKRNPEVLYKKFWNPEEGGQ